MSVRRLILSVLFGGLLLPGAVYAGEAPTQVDLNSLPLQRIHLDSGWTLDVPAGWVKYDSLADSLGMFFDPASGSTVNLSVYEVDDRLIELLRTSSSDKRSSLERALLDGLDEEFLRVGRIRQHQSADIAELGGYGALRLRYWMNRGPAAASGWQVVQYLVPLDQSTYNFSLTLTEGADIDSLDRHIAASLDIDPALAKGAVPADEIGQGYSVWHSSANYVDEETAGLFLKMALGGAALLALIALIIYIKYRQGFFKVPQNHRKPNI